MTREKIKKYIEEKFAFLAISDAFMVVDKIFDDIESKTCENCKYHQSYSEDTLNIDGCNDTYCNRIGVNTPSYFGCNKFERK